MSEPTKEQLELAAAGIAHIDDAIRELRHAMNAVTPSRFWGSIKLSSADNAFHYLADRLIDLRDLIRHEADSK